MLLYLVRALAAVDIFVSTLQLIVNPSWWSAVALIFGIALMIAFLIADGVIGTWRETRDAEEELIRRILEENRGRVIIIMMNPLDPEKIFPVDKAERDKEERGGEDDE